MSFPQTIEELRAAGYKFERCAYCRGCGRLIEWWITTASKPIPMDIREKEADKVTTHFATCPKANQFRKQGGLFA